MSTATPFPTINVRIYHQEYSIRSDGESEHLRRLAADLNDRMCDIAYVTGTRDSLKLAVLAAMHFAHDLFYLKHEEAKEDARVAAVSDECGALLDEILGTRPSYANTGEIGSAAGVQEQCVALSEELPARREIPPPPIEPDWPYELLFEPEEQRDERMADRLALRLRLSGPRRRR